MGDPRNVVGHVPGRICVGPTNLSLAYPHGGVDIGEIGPTSFSIARPRTIIRDEVTGYDTVEVVSHGESAAMFSAIRDVNPEGYELFLGSTAGPNTREPLTVSNAGDQAGRINSDDAAVFLFSPYDTVGDPGVLIYAGVPLLDETTELNLMLGGDDEVYTLGIVIELIRNETDNIWASGQIADMAL